ncbi:calcium-binding protein [Microvirga sp. P5_D2]
MASRPSITNGNTSATPSFQLEPVFVSRGGTEANDAQGGFPSISAGGHFAAHQSVASEFLVNDKTEFAQKDSAIAPLAGGGFVVGWVDVQSVPQIDPAGGAFLPVSDQIRGRMFDPTGQPVASSSVFSGQEQPTDTYFSNVDGIALMNGDVAFGWRTRLTDVYEEQTRTFPPELIPTSDVTRPEFGGSSSPRSELELAATTGGDYFLAYLTDGAARIVAVSGDSRTFPGSQTGESKALSLVELADDHAAIVYYGPILPPDFEPFPDTLNFQKLDATGMALGPPHLIPVEQGSLNAISSALLSNGNIVVLLGSTSMIQGTALIIDPDGNIVIPAFAAGGPGGEVAALSEGGFAIAWTDSNPATGDGSGSAIKTQVFSNNGAPLGPERLVNISTSGDQYDPNVTGLANGEFVVSWTDASGQGGDASSTSIKARIFEGEVVPPVDGVVKDGDEGNNVLKGTGRDDILRGHGGKDWLFGGKGDDSLDGSEDKDKISASKGDDTVLGGTGNDRIWTGTGSDVIVFNEGDGHDRVFDFDHRFDRVRLDVNIGTNAIDDFAELEGLVASGEIGVSTQRCSLTLTFDNGDALTLRGIRELSADDWLFI